LREVDLEKKAVELKNKFEKQEINIELFRGGLKQMEK